MSTCSIIVCANMNHFATWGGPGIFLAKINYKYSVILTEGEGYLKVTLAYYFIKVKGIKR